jgi:hypothetical protein
LTPYARNLSVVFAALVPLIVTSAARAQVQPPDPGASGVDAYVETVPATRPSAVDAYVETVPTAGSRPRPGARKAARSSLTPAARAALEKLPPATASALEKVSSSPVYGAPTPRQRRSAAVEAAPSVSLGDTLRGTADAIDTGSDTRLLGLVAVLLVTTVGATVLAARRARGPSSGPDRS